MTALHRLQIARLQLGWMLVVLGVLVVFGSMSLPLFLSASLVGMIVLVEMGTPRYVRPVWIIGLRRFVLVCLVVFGVYVVVRLALLLPPGAL